MASCFWGWTGRSRIAVIVLVSAWSLSSLAIGPRSDHKLSPAICAGMLKAGSQLPNGNPLVSLRDVQYKLKSLRKTPSAPPNVELTYMSAQLKIDQDRPKLNAVYNRVLESIVARLSQLENQSTQINFDGLVVGYEFRGVDQVTAARKVMADEMQDVHERSLEILTLRYPKLRMSTLFKHSLTAYVLGGSTFLLLNDASSLTPYIFGFGVLTAWLNEFALPWVNRLMTTENMRPQLTVIDQVLAQTAVGHPLSVVSGSVIMKTNLHKALIDLKVDDLNADEIQMVADASEPLRRYFFDESHESREFKKLSAGLSSREVLQLLVDRAAKELAEHPEGKTRHVFYDSIFYVDQETAEPVWLMYYRAFKQRPAKPKSPTKKPEKKRSEDRSWLPGLTPAYVPVRVR